ncbi:hypothetical protein Amsp01_050680 [Amycolatopsis sp. NBRC 101858]|nr:hypothetical protein Amsp01_050680 [Amycolatopsis sp. NBRC 101858]
MAGRRKLTAIATAHAPRMGTQLVDAIVTALGEQPVIVPGTTAADLVLPRDRPTAADQPSGHPRRTATVTGTPISGFRYGG